METFLMLDNGLESPRENGFDTPRSYRQQTDRSMSNQDSKGKISENIMKLNLEFLKEDKFKGLGKSMTVFDLDDHIRDKCPRNRVCYECEILFETKVQLINHYKRECPHIIV